MAAAQCGLQHAELQPVIYAFSKLYGKPPFAVASAPGRVNLIGEHIDYEGYGVMPMAISQACQVAISWQGSSAVTYSSSSGTLPSAAAGHSHQQQQPVMLIANMQQELYPAGQLLLDPAADQPQGCPGWFKYIHAAYKGCVEFAASKQEQVPSDGNILLLVHSTVPPGAGLSSSSTLVVSAALALLALWGLPATPPQEAADFTCRCEKYVGTQGGGMDQAVSLMAQPGVAMHVEFNPVRASAVSMPTGGVFVVANSLAASLKAETASSRFNLRVLECRLAAMLLAKQLADHTAAGTGRNSGSSSALDWRCVKVLRDVEQHLLMLPARPCAAAGTSQAEQDSSWAGQQQQDDTSAQLSKAVQQLLPQEAYQLEQVVQLLGCSQPELVALLPPALQAAAALAPSLLLQQRALHVFSEAQRVEQFKQVCHDTQLSNASKLAALGVLMDASHASCAGLYQCSCDELDRLVQVARGAGALGARLTGAGWGGCVVALVAEAHVDEFMAQLTRQYYQPAIAAGSLQALEQLGQCLFRSPPSGGASVVLM